MLAKTTQLGLPRRVIGYYLLFGLAAVTWLSIGVIITSQSLIASHSESASLDRLGAAAHEVAVDYLKSGKGHLQTLIERLSTSNSLAYCAFADETGRFIAHSIRDQVGRDAKRPTGALEQWGEVARVRFVDANSQILLEYRTPVHKGTQTLGTLHMAVPELGMMELMQTAAQSAPTAIFGPLLLMSLGAIVLQKTVRPVSGIEQQLGELALAASPADMPLVPVGATGPAAIGWNRLVEERTRDRQHSNLELRLEGALEGFRERKADQILNSLPDGVALTDDEGGVTFSNQAICALLGHPAEGGGLCGKQMIECLALDPQSDSGNPLMNPESLERTVVAEVGRSGDMTQGVLRVARHPLFGASRSSRSGHVWCVRDITQQKLADQMRNQFVNSATHELRTPLANIKAYAETLVLSDMIDVEQQKKFCNTIHSETTRLARFIDDLLCVSSIEVGSLALVRQETDMARLLAEVVEKVRPQMDQKHIELHYTPPEKMPKLRIDKDKFNAALVNLLGNAAKYTPEGGQVNFRVQVKTDALHIDVEDSGFGISAAELPKIFDKFFRSSDARVQEQTGSGLGLSLTQEIIRLHGGKLGVQSELNKGSRFTVTLPLS